MIWNKTKIYIYIYIYRVSQYSVILCKIISPSTFHFFQSKITITVVLSQFLFICLCQADQWWLIQLSTITSFNITFDTIHSNLFVELLLSCRIDNCLNMKIRNKYCIYISSNFYDLLNTRTRQKTALIPGTLVKMSSFALYLIL